MKKKYSDEELINSIVLFYKTKGYIPKASDFTSSSSTPSRGTIQKRFGSWNNAVKLAGLQPHKIKKNDGYWSLSKVKKAILLFHSTYKRNPTQRDFSSNIEYPDHKTVLKYFDSWGQALLESGLSLDNSYLYGTPTKALDGHTYRSKAEAYLVDKFLYGKYEYIIEPKYPEPYYKFYDWYIPSIDLYIELDGGIRPETTKEKIEINRLLNRNCLFISINSLYKKDCKIP